MTVKKSTALSQRLQDLFSQVNKTIEHMLNNLTYIYQSHGINYKVDGFFQSLLRMLTPFQLLCYFHLYDIQTLFDKESKNFWSFRDQMKYVNTNSTKVISQFMNMKKIENVIEYNVPVVEPENSVAQKIRKHGGYTAPKKNRESENKLPQDTSEKQEQGDYNSERQRQNLLRSYTSGLKKGNASKPHLSSQKQLKISQWVIAMAAKGILVSKTDIIQQARLLSCGNTGSTGWCRGFLHRHPYLLRYIKRAKPSEREKFLSINSQEGRRSELYSEEQNKKGSRVDEEQKCFEQSQNYSGNESLMKVESNGSRMNNSGDNQLKHVYNGESLGSQESEYIMERYQSKGRKKK